WRLATPLPPWAESLSGRERVLAHWTERVLYGTMFVIPLSGLWIIAAGEDDLVAVHVAAHVVFFVAIATHVGLVLKHQLIDRDRLLRRMI
uniref:cytochrome b n=1 Tax=Ilumatobacter nonamiensis TaxID=467093 RepID=UPI0019D405C6